MADQGMYVSNRDVRIITTKGFTYSFKKGEPKFVAPLVREEMLQHGILPVDGDLPIHKPEEVPAEPIGPGRVDRIFKTVLEIVADNKSNEFTAGGIPKADAFKARAGFEASRRELNDAFKKYLAERHLHERAVVGE